MSEYFWMTYSVALLLFFPWYALWSKGVFSRKCGNCGHAANEHVGREVLCVHTTRKARNAAGVRYAADPDLKRLRRERRAWAVWDRKRRARRKR